MRSVLLSFIAAAFLASTARADIVNVAVAANFTDAANELAAAFGGATGHQAILSFGSTGQLYTQITQSAPFEIFLAADTGRPALAVEEGFGVEGSVFTYAIGQLVLYSADGGRVTGPGSLEAADVRQVAIANPETAPYGKAAVEAMRSLGVYEALRARLVQGQNIGQAYQFVETGNAEIGFVALGQIAQTDKGSRWIVPQEHYEPIRQDAVLLKTGADNPAVAAFITFLKGEAASAIIENYGYALDR